MKYIDKLWILSMKCGALTGCHQKPERSFFIGNFQMPVCARCTGIMIAKPFAVIYARKRNLPLPLTIIFILPMILDGVLQYRFFIESNNKRRLVTGFFGGFAVYSAKMKFIKKVLGEN